MAADLVSRTLRRIASTLPGGGEDRPGQRRMAEAVHQSITRGRHLVVQAGTGTGKSLAYLVPAALSGRPVVVATATKALQEQLAGKDLPAVAAGIAKPVAFAVLKGRRNYLCLARAAEVSGGGFQQTLAPDDAPAADGALVAGGPDGPATAGGARAARGADPDRLAAQVRRLLDWAATSPTGDGGELPFEPHPRAWAMLSVGAEECPGAARCPQGADCFAERARRRAAEADVVVVNTHLYGAHLASGGAVLPPHDVVVFDEAHELEDVMTQSLGVELAPGRLAALHAIARPLLAADDVAAADLSGVADRLRPVLAELAGTAVLAAPPDPDAPSDGPTPPDTATPPDPTDAPAPGDGGRGRAFFGLPAHTPSAHAELVSLLELAASRLERLRALLLSGADPRVGGGAPDPDGGRRQRALAAAATLAGDLDRLSSRSPDEVAWVEMAGRTPVLRLAPIDVGPALAGALWGSVTAVLTSATVGPTAVRRLGLDGSDVDVLDVGSPFDYRSHALLYVARHLPDPRRAGGDRALHDELGALIDAAGGRTLALFTSRRATDAAAAALRDRLAYTVLVQGELPKARLLEAFAGEETSCLFATLGFWQGVDVPGPALSLVTLDRLPFGRPDDPLLVARRRRAGPAAFASVDLPRAATLLAQGVGRLIRTATDTGVVAVLDPRLATAGYRRVLLDALPPLRRTVDRHEVEAFFARQPAPAPAVPSRRRRRGSAFDAERSATGGEHHDHGA